MKNRKMVRNVGLVSFHAAPCTPEKVEVYQLNGKLLIEWEETLRAACGKPKEATVSLGYADDAAASTNHAILLSAGQKAVKVGIEANHYCRKMVVRLSLSNEEGRSGFSAVAEVDLGFPGAPFLKKQLFISLNSPLSKTDLAIISIDDEAALLKGV